MTDELKQWEYDRGYAKGKADALEKIRAEVEEMKFVYNGKTLKEWIDLMASGYCVVLPDGATNGEIVKAVFPNLEQDKERLRQKYGSQALYDTFEKWCELPYKAGDTDGNS